MDSKKDVTVAFTPVPGDWVVVQNRLATGTRVQRAGSKDRRPTVWQDKWLVYQNSMAQGAVFSLVRPIESHRASMFTHLVRLGYHFQFVPLWRACEYPFGFTYPSGLGQPHSAV